MDANAIKKVNNYLEHFGIMGMKWGHRRSIGITPKRQAAFDKKDLERLDKGGHVHIGFTKKRQAAYDKRDRAAIEKSLDKNTKRIKTKEPDSEDFTRKEKLKKKNPRTMSNTELKALNERLQLEKTYRELSKPGIVGGKKVVTEVLKSIGKELVKEAIKSSAKSVVKGVKEGYKG